MARSTLGKVCPGCGEFKEWQSYHKNSSQTDGHNSRCKSCRAKLHKDSYERKPTKPTLGNTYAQKKYRCRTMYDTTPEQYDQVLSIGYCEICGSTEDLVYDHDHVTMKARGCLCRGCNRAIGQLGDNLAGLLNAVKYLEAHDVH